MSFDDSLQYSHDFARLEKARGIVSIDATKIRRFEAEFFSNLKSAAI